MSTVEEKKEALERALNDRVTQLVNADPQSSFLRGQLEMLRNLNGQAEPEPELTLEAE